ncbi:MULTISPECIES: 2,5-diamino-6-(ribosylamino)-4(3H)-pyrimidinone 5'-phosphate reductase [Methanobacterium]|uniref:2,5-diamino-6-(ribosylamino)-4(3H)-pyrimidinone 5'-phosphate reductase n=1 Tax=Methanobacterium veterum TaxID=408577 RepID=A0A9E5A5U1_9EURY|nr:MULTISPECIES: 2,5-diamino-6-(ribosylamino)-4(3H)-pyrimidinone 5'-phosphate reductase [Methanobacterium]MCZ3367088.1 2,5-diamino-6-(ribosylamino)-4(3H)-pyrimidinone 5'-phosphate reductase [Methanobacterium veterum]MCZ3373764.1 2,5-diamino-6-(ribosylamino)-4(3H)-pyrimidinone 5'-phosphate reductase [Methanobacterium veterum]
MKPHVILNAAMTLDGKIATRTGSSEISGKEDLIRVHKLRKDMDAIMVGINTLLADDPRLTVHKIEADPEDNPVRIVVDSKARTPLNFRILNNDAPTIIATTENTDPEKTEALEKKATVLKCGKDRVDLKSLMNELSKTGIKTLMLEGGSTLNYSMLENGLVDEVRVCVAPMIAGGSNAKTLVDGEGIDKMKDAVKLKLKKSYGLGEDLILEYDVI